MPYVGQHGCEALKKYKYSGMDLSLTSKYLFQPFWSRFVLLFPLNIAPNTITLMGFAFILVSCAISYLYSPQLTTPSPRWIYLLHGIFLFLYQTFDAVDGKQARRTNSSSPLGEIFDHSCDALACGLEALSFSSVMLSGRTVLWQWALATVPFYFATWETYFTDTLCLQVVNGPTEGLLMIYLAEMLTTLLGGEWWTKDFRDALLVPGTLSFFPRMPLNQFVLWIMLFFGLIPTVIDNALTVRRVVREKRRGSFVGALSLVLPYFVLLGSIVLWSNISPSDVIGTRPHLLILGTGFAFALLVGRLILAHLCDEHEGLLRNMYTPLAVLPLALANAFSAQLRGGKPLVDEQWLLLAFVAHTGLAYAHFAHGLIRDICACLNIYAFRIGKPQLRHED